MVNPYSAVPDISLGREFLFPQTVHSALRVPYPQKDPTANPLKRMQYPVQIKTRHQQRMDRLLSLFDGNDEAYGKPTCFPDWEHPRVWPLECFLMEE